ncbi:putative pre-mRNA splicing Prp18-interacting factor [Lupinus albus]|uniref:Pre-mRNA-splicing factor SLU7 n=1 Tax=Lupinus albus TaxID=3870 RepID=A0A6A4R8E5_LUPAL|nr:putative pre-mRNA splicing Prp18-interacting factor [Lupinus albus]
MQAAPSQAELLYKNFKVMKEKLKSQTKDTLLEKYGNAAGCYSAFRRVNNANKYNVVV